jgi:uncharacterized protein (TIGR03083 family)
MTMKAVSPGTVGYEEWMEIAATEYRRIDLLLRDLTPEEWSRPTDCDGWDVRAIVAHLAGGAEAAASVREMLRQAWRGRSLPGLLVDKMNAVQVRERGHLTDEELRLHLSEAARRGMTARRRVPRPVRAVPMPLGAPLGTRPLGYLMGRIYSRDAWLHRVDICRAVGREVELTAAHDKPIVEDVVAEWASRHGSPYSLSLTGTAGGSWCSGTNGEQHTVDAIDFCRIVSGRGHGSGLLRTPVPF